MYCQCIRWTAGRLTCRLTMPPNPTHLPTPHTSPVTHTQWLDGEKLSQSQADDVGRLVNVGVICYLKQLLE